MTSDRSSAIRSPRAQTTGKLDAASLLQPAASPLSLQTALSARVAFPRGLVSKLKMECDNQFFLSASLKPALFLDRAHHLARQVFRTLFQ